MSWDVVKHYWQDITALSAVLSVVVSFLTIGWVLTIKKDPTSALAWCLLILFVPVIGVFLFVILGYQSVSWPLSRKKKHNRVFRLTHPPERRQAEPGGDSSAEPDPSWEGLGRLALCFDAFPRTEGNHVRFYYEGQPAFNDKLAAILAARHHIHLEYFIFQPDATGLMFLEALTQKAREGVEVRLVYDAMGSIRLHRSMLRPLLDAGGRCSAFLPLNLLRRRIQVNLRNHRKILVVDGRVAFTGGLNIGDEYLGKNPRFGFWRDTHLRLEGPAVASLQRIFIEDWDFATGEHLKGDAYFPAATADDAATRRREDAATTDPAPVAASPPPRVPASLLWPVQVIHSGPDQAVKGIREIYFAAIERARHRLWIASPYFVPDAGLKDALCLAGYLGVDVRLLCQFHPDKWLPYFAARYYWSDVLDAGLKVYQYTRGMMHSKVVLVDGRWASVGSANLDNRSMHLNFEVNCLIDTPDAVAELEQAFLRDLESAIQLEPDVYAHRPFAGRLIENACRLFSPVL